MAGLEEPEAESPRSPGRGAWLTSSTVGVQYEADGEWSGPADHSPHRAVTPTPPGKSNRKKKTKILLDPNTGAKASIQSQRPSLSQSVTQGEQGEGRKTRVRSKSTDGFDSLLTSEGKQSVSQRHHALQPLHLVSPQYEILDTELLPNGQTLHGLPVSGHKYNKQRAASTGRKLKPLLNNTEKKLQQRLNAEPRHCSFHMEEESGIMRFSGSLRLDTMDLVPGVSLSESLTAGPPVPLGNMAELRPMRRYPALPKLTTEQCSTQHSTQHSSGVHTAGVPAQAMSLE